jgi:hypothetical protein
VIVVYCRGGDKFAPIVARFAGMLYGTRHDYIPYAHIYLLDIHWTKYDWSDYLRKAAAWKPVMAMAPDYERPDQLPALLSQIGDLRGLGIRPMVCPKFAGAVSDIPPDCIVSISVPSDYAGFLPDRRELGGRELHFLGGSPSQQRYLMARYDNAQTVSADGNKLGYKAMKGQYWHSQQARWVDVRGQYSTQALQLASAWHIVRYLNAPHSFVRHGKSVQKCWPKSEQLALPFGAAGVEV